MSENNNGDSTMVANSSITDPLTIRKNKNSSKTILKVASQNSDVLANLYDYLLAVFNDTLQKLSVYPKDVFFSLPVFGKQVQICQHSSISNYIENCCSKIITLLTLNALEGFQLDILDRSAVIQRFAFYIDGEINLADFSKTSPQRQLEKFSETLNDYIIGLADALQEQPKIDYSKMSRFQISIGIKPDVSLPSSISDCQSSFPWNTPHVPHASLEIKQKTTETYQIEKSSMDSLMEMEILPEIQDVFLNQLKEVNKKVEHTIVPIAKSFGPLTGLFQLNSYLLTYSKNVEKFTNNNPLFTPNKRRKEVLYPKTASPAGLPKRLKIRDEGIKKLFEQKMISSQCEMFIKARSSLDIIQSERGATGFKKIKASTKNKIDVISNENLNSASNFEKTDDLSFSRDSNEPENINSTEVKGSPSPQPNNSFEKYQALRDAITSQKIKKSIENANNIEGESALNLSPKSDSLFTRQMVLQIERSPTNGISKNSNLENYRNAISAPSSPKSIINSTPPSASSKLSPFTTSPQRKTRNSPMGTSPTTTSPQSFTLKKLNLKNSGTRFN